MARLRLFGHRDPSTCLQRKNRESRWLRTNEAKREGENEIAAYDIFNPDGIYEARVWLDVIPAVFAGGGKMYLMNEDETTGIRRVKRCRVVWKEN